MSSRRSKFASLVERKEQARRARAVMPQARETGRAAPCPPALTGGETSQDAQMLPPGSAKVDWLTCTFGVEPDAALGRELWEVVSGWLGGSVVAEDCPGLLGYEFGTRFYLVAHGTPVLVGRCDWGGDRHQGRARLDVSGSGCSKVRNWHAVHEFVQSLPEVRITRVDLAVDCLMGEFTVEDARDWYLGGEFHAGGRRPRHSLVGDWLDPQYGRTLEIGRRTNGKMLRAYEKGRQLGDTVSPWTRFEVELRNIDREIPLDVLVRPDTYFTGAYACLERLLDVAGERIKTQQAEGEIALGHLTTHARSSYGQLVNVLRVKLSAEQVLDVICRDGLPRRLEKASLTAFHQIGADALLPDRSPTWTAL